MGNLPHINPWTIWGCWLLHIVFLSTTHVVIQSMIGKSQICHIFEDKDFRMGGLCHVIKVLRTLLSILSSLRV